MAFDLRRDPDKLLLLLVISDVVFVVLHTLHTYSGFFVGSWFSIGRERGFAESFQYLKEGWIVLMLLFLTLKQRILLYPAWCSLFAYVLADDFFGIHEQLGERLASHLGVLPMFGLRAVDFGELGVTAFAAVSLLGLIGVAHYRGDRDTRSFSRSLLALLVALGFFGVLGDMVHAMVMKHPIWDFVLEIIEDGGEMVVMSVIVWAVFHRWRSRWGADAERREDRVTVMGRPQSDARTRL